MKQHLVNEGPLGCSRFIISVWGQSFPRGRHYTQEVDRVDGLCRNYKFHKMLYRISDLIFFTPDYSLT